MTIPELIAGNGTAFSYEVLPPLKGNGIDGLRKTIDRLREDLLKTEREQQDTAQNTSTARWRAA